MRPPICVKETVPEVLAGLRQFKANAFSARAACALGPILATSNVRKPQCIPRRLENTLGSYLHSYKPQRRVLSH